jgi:hypothetical protein
MAKPSKRQRETVMGQYAADPPLAVPDLAIAAQLLGRPLPMVERAARKVEPYRHADGTPRWSLRELAIALGLDGADQPRPAEF